MKKKIIAAPVWKVHGRRLKIGHLNDSVEGELKIPQQLSNLGMRKPPLSNAIIPQNPLPGSWGIPVEADLAAYLIRKAFDETHGFFGELFANKNESKKIDNFKNELFHLLYGITFDKTIILQILGQPNCEGLRSYLCVRGKDDDKHVSLVIVGVDVNGYDLNYSTTTNKSTTIPTMSLIGEYGFPPGGNKIMNEDIDDHYCLLKYAASKK